MYSTCIFCHAPLGVNESIEHFPIGRRITFDPVTGRLWAVCRRCERWNLSPIEERWEALEECEIAFRSTTLRLSTGQIGMARMRDGTDLIRIGHPLRPEMAAWRYGDQFGRRRRKHAIVVATIAVAVATLYGAGLAVGAMGLVAANLSFSLVSRTSRKRIRLRTHVGGTLVGLSAEMLAHVELRPNAEAGYELRIPIAHQGLRIGHEHLTVRGPEALVAAAVLLPNINSRGASDRSRVAALDLLERFKEADDAFIHMATADRPRRWTGASLASGSILSDPWFRIGRLRASERLCLEMIVHEEEEREALSGELAGLESRWKEAEEIARLSDALLSDDVP
jgi:hypothetical protein